MGLVLGDLRGQIGQLAEADIRRIAHHEIKELRLQGHGKVTADGQETPLDAVETSVAGGHRQGAGGQVAWGDPVSGLSFCLLTNGLDANPLRSARFCAAANNRAGACIPLS